MYHFFVDPGQIGEKEIRIQGSDVNHIRNVLRMKPGEEIRICTGQDSRDYRCRIEQLKEDEVTAQILWVEDSHAELPSRLILFQALPKSDKMELIIQKAVELGVYRIIPMETRRCIVRLKAGKEETKLRRWNAIAESAAKQSKRMIVPEVAGVMTFDQALSYAASLDRLCIPYEMAENMEKTREWIRGICPGQSVGIMIGPEGGFEPEEVEKAETAGAAVLSLGRRILRTETAGMTLLSALMLQLDR